MKSEMPYLGVQTAGMAEVAREVFPAHTLATFDNWRETIVALWSEAQFREERYAALGLIAWRSYKSFRTSLAALPLYERFIVAGGGGGVSDGAPPHAGAVTLSRFPVEHTET